MLTKDLVYVFGTLYYITVTLRYADFEQKPWRYTVFWKKSHLVHKYKPHEARFCAARFFSGTKNSVSQGLAVLIHQKKIRRAPWKNLGRFYGVDFTGYPSNQFSGYRLNRQLFWCASTASKPLFKISWVWAVVIYHKKVTTIIIY